MFDPHSELSACHIRVLAGCAFPDDGYPPAVPQQTGDCGDISFVIPLEFVIPESGSSLRQTEVRTARMSVPEAAVHENNGVPLGEHQIRPAGQVLSVQLVPESGAP